MNQAFVCLVGFEREEAIGMIPSAFHPPELQGCRALQESLEGRRLGTTPDAFGNDLKFQAAVRGRAMPYRGRTDCVTALHPLTGMIQDAQVLSGLRSKMLLSLFTERFCSKGIRPPRSSVDHVKILLTFHTRSWHDASVVG